jgi:hypothetical protein
VNDSSATIIATPTAIPRAVAMVRAGLRRRFAVTIGRMSLAYPL